MSYIYIYSIYVGLHYSTEGHIILTVITFPFSIPVFANRLARRALPTGFPNGSTALSTGSELWFGTLTPSASFLAMAT